MKATSILHDMRPKLLNTYVVKSGYKLANNIPFKVLTFGFSLAAKIKREFITRRVKTALQQRKSEGQRLGREHGSLLKITKLTGKRETIKTLMSQKVSVSAIARMLNVNHSTLNQYNKTHTAIQFTIKRYLYV